MMSLKVSLRHSKEKREAFLKASSPRAKSGRHLCGLRGRAGGWDGDPWGLSPGSDTHLLFVWKNQLTTLCPAFLINESCIIIPVLPLDIWKGWLVESTVERGNLIFLPQGQSCLLLHSEGQSRNSFALRLQPHLSLPIAWPRQVHGHQDLELSLLSTWTSLSLHLHVDLQFLWLFFLGGGLGVLESWGFFLAWNIFSSPHAAFSSFRFQFNCHLFRENFPGYRIQYCSLCCRPQALSVPSSSIFVFGCVPLSTILFVRLFTSLLPKPSLSWQFLEGSSLLLPRACSLKHTYVYYIPQTSTEWKNLLAPFLLPLSPFPLCSTLRLSFCLLWSCYFCPAPCPSPHLLL